VGVAAGPGALMLVRRRVRRRAGQMTIRRLGGWQMLRAPTRRGRDRNHGTAGRFDAMRGARGVSDGLDARYRDCDGARWVGGIAGRVACVRSAEDRPADSGNTAWRYPRVA
jgi:hypothetical protein